MALSLPLEIQEHILSFAQPVDVASVSQTCRAMGHRISRSTHLWRSLFLAHDLFDDPRLSEDYTPIFDWKEELQVRVRFLNICRSKPGVSEPDVRYAITTFITLLTTFIPRYPTRSKFWDGPILDLYESLALLAENRCNDLLLHLDALIIRPSGSSASVHRSFVYDLHNYEHGPGPIMSTNRRSRSVSWQHIHHIRWHIYHVSTPASPTPQHLEATRPYSGCSSQGPDDWAGVEGQWVGYFVFLDGDDFFTYNASSSDSTFCPKFTCLVSSRPQTTGPWTQTLLTVSKLLKNVFGTLISLALNGLQTRAGQKSCSSPTAASLVLTS